MSKIITITELYLEIEGTNLVPPKNKSRILRAFLYCECGQFHIKPVRLKITDFGKQKHCKCGNLIYTIGKKTIQSVYISGKEQTNETTSE